MKDTKKANLPVPDFLKFEEFALPNPEQLVDEILKLKADKGIYIALHTSQGSESRRAVADMVGSLKEVADHLKTVSCDTILFTGTMADAGVLKMLHPNKTILFPEENDFFGLEDLNDEESTADELLEEIYLALKYEFPYALLIDQSFEG